MSKIVLITGATSGIGKACAEIFCKNNFDVIITGRRKELLLNLSSYLINKYQVKVHPINFDIRQREEIIKAITHLPAEFKDIDILINNAGLALGTASFNDCQIDDWEQMIDTNIKGLLYITKAITPIFIKKCSGHIINIGSIAGRESYKGGNVYCATKAAVNSLTKSLRIDLVSYGIKVSQIAPGAAETEFSVVRYKGDKDLAKSVYNGFEPLSAEDIANTVFFIASQPKHVNIEDVLITPIAQASTSIFNRK